MSPLKCTILSLLAGLTTQGALAGPLPIDLGAAGSFAVLAGSEITNTGASVVYGNVGVWPNDTVTGFPSGLVVNGNIYAGGLAAMQAQTALAAAYQAASGETGALSLTGQDLGGMTLAPGVYAFASSAQLTGTLTLNAANLTDAVFIFQIGSSLTAASDAVVQLLNFSAGDQVIWQVGSSAFLGSGTSFAGDILALTSITLDTGAGITCGGALAINGAVTLQDNDILSPGASCSAGALDVPEPDSASLLSAGLLVTAFAYMIRKYGAYRLFAKAA
jgi:type VI secretion system secreted protein VgrG